MTTTNPSVCVHCGYLNPLAARYCCGCGTILGDAGQSVASIDVSGAGSPASKIEANDLTVGERRVVSVLFADIKDSIAVIERLELDRSRTLLDRITNLLAEATHRFGGMVSQNLGDGIMALFGAPMGQEDHAHRACQAALAMLEDMGDLNETLDETDRVAIRIGIDSGEVITRAVPSDWALHYSAVGLVTHTASRAQNVADPNTAIVAAQTQRLAADAFLFRAMGDRQLKGMSHEVSLWHLIANRVAHRRSSWSTGDLFIPFVGRDAELARLVQHVRSDRFVSAGAIAVTGNAGVGKSRLVQELVDTIADDEIDIVYVRVDQFGERGVGRMIPDLLRSILDLQSSVACEAVTQALERLGLPQAMILSPLLAWLDLQTDPNWLNLPSNLRLAQLRQSACAVALAAAHRRRLLIVLEDLHYAGQLGREVVRALAQAAVGHRLMVLATWRDNADLLPTSTDITGRMALAPFRGSEIGSLIDRVLGRGQSLAALRESIVQRTAGNALFAVETLRELVERGIVVKQDGRFELRDEREKLPLSPNIQSVITSRLDRLPAEAKRVLRAASVQGRQGPIGRLVAFFGDELEVFSHLDCLVAGGTIKTTGIGDRAQFEFSHDLVWEVVYNGMVADQRQSFHRRFAALIDGDLQNLSSETRVQLAFHTERGALWDRAYACWRLIGDRAMARSAPSDAQDALTRAGKALDERGGHPGRDDDRLQLKFLEINIAFLLGEHGRMGSVIDEALDLANQTKSGIARAKLLSRRASQHRLRGELADALAIARDAYDLAVALDHLELKINCAFRLGILNNGLGRFEQAITWLDLALNALPVERELERFGNMSIAASSIRAAMARALGELGDYDRGKILGQEAMRIAIEQDDTPTKIYSTQELGLYYIRVDDLETAIDVLEIGRCSAAGDAAGFLLISIEAELGYALALRGDVGQGVELLEAATKRARASKILPQFGQQLGFLSEAYYLNGQIEAARQAAIEGFRLTRLCGEEADRLWIELLWTSALTERDRNWADRRLCRLADRAKRLSLHTLERRCRALVMDVEAKVSNLERHPESV
ncbi:MAG: adenylate/guanylate cyclase domain-containing protein [Geminicoccaceae bacterium]